jgi:dipeptidase D
MSLFKSLEPRDIWKYFEEILTIPRPSEKEEKIRAYLVKFAKTNELDYEIDNTGNLVIRKESSPGLENKPAVILQSHMDMVCEKNSNIEIDFNSDPIPAYVDGNWVKSKGTTLGADDGIGIAAQLAILADKDLFHGPIECLFTVAEETGLTGAFGLEPGLLKGTLLLNLDSEDDGEIFIGCAGGVDVTAWFDYALEKVPENHIGVKISFSGLKGGHSGDDISKGLGNAVKSLNQFLWENSDELDLRISRFEGGNLRNAIAREALATVTLPKENLASLEARLNDFRKEYALEFPKTEPDFNFTIEKTDRPQEVIDEDTQSNLLNALYGCPHGVISWSQTLENMVETSTNLAAIKFEENRIKITTSQRSSLESAKRGIANMVESVFLLAGAETQRNGGYPGWNPNPDSQLVRVAASLYEEMFNQKPAVRAIHAGLECGLFLEKYPDLDMISFGPTIKGAHSPDERLDIHTTQKFYSFLKEILTRL